eukprot:TRINITY_DN40127_c0_g1_i1.p1 TRINITY_DN40127_c0_g1~~TRINITY_DN40127_c0_g1_i1.p1  ORF type:complete len:716 (+),score=138.54 TRINITY_DN40127_c0_g1_i1:56-2149(+)
MRGRWRGVLRQLLTASAAGLLLSAPSALADSSELLAEVERLKAEVERLKAGGAAPTQPQVPQQPSFAQQQSFGQQPRSQQTPPDPLAAARELAALRDPAGGRASGAGLASGIGRGASPAADGCSANPLFATLQNALQKLALLEQDPVEASFQIHEAWEENPALFEECPAGVVTALVYLSIAQDKEWKYRLLHRATYLLYSTPGLPNKMVTGRWPMSDRLIRTMYHNSEVMGKQPMKLADVEVQPRGISAAQAAGIPGVDEAVDLSLRHRDSVSVHFTTVLFYHFYHQERSPCACRTRSWCAPFWTRHVTNNSVDIWLAARDEQKTLYRMDRSGCLRNTGHTLMSHYFAEPIDLLFVFEINALMHPMGRVIPARRALLYPTYDLSDSQIANFEELGVSVLPDDAILKPPNPAFRKLLDEATTSRQAKMQRPKDRLVIFPADIKPIKGQLDFLSGLLFEGARRPSAVQRLRGLTIVVAGGCDGNQTYCSEVVEVTQRINAEKLLNIVVADQLKDDELAQLYTASLGVVLHSVIDCNPRAVYEGLVTDTPFFVTESARLPALVQHLGHVTDGDPSMVAERLADFVDLCEAGGFTGRPREFARRHLTEAENYRKLVEWMDSKYISGKTLDAVIRGEEALGTFGGGLGSILGGGGAGGLAGLAASFGGAGGLGGSSAAGASAGRGGAATGGMGFSMKEPMRR